MMLEFSSVELTISSLYHIML